MVTVSSAPVAQAAVVYGYYWSWEWERAAYYEKYKPRLSVSVFPPVSRVSAFVDTGDARLGRASFFPAADATFTPIFAVPSGARLLRQIYPHRPLRPLQWLPWHCRPRACHQRHTACC